MIKIAGLHEEKQLGITEDSHILVEAAKQSTNAKGPTFNGTKAELKQAIAETESSIKFFEKLGKRKGNEMYKKLAEDSRKVLADLYAADLNGNYIKN